ncbi:class I adenylate-forming enzyme family protein [Fictibacillus enclensis]|uniref:class I adenylate-forming enzyme family protein n=1 Tax=Fictibacillus enclensis TaxID=1017270 RepID=UPI00259FE41D|nr:class I adenylate-forming enzyme family protein [Fictibacillus enclensis]MDM5197071.1 class I adenylate-forming enzyme family protein [Fictibacillus enclensis]
MIRGDQCWGDTIKNGLQTVVFNNKVHSVLPGMRETVYESLTEQAKRWPDKLAIVDTNEREYTYLQLLQLTDRFSSYLWGNHGINRGKKVGLLLYNSVEYAVAFLACQRLGAVVVPLPTKYRESEIDALLDKSDCDLIIADGTFSAWMEKYEISELRILISPSKEIAGGYAFAHYESMDEIKEPSRLIESNAIIMFTSGTTSQSKGVLIKNYNIQHALKAYEELFQLNEDDSTILAIPVYNVTGLVATLSLFLSIGASIRLHKFFDAKQLINEMKEHHISFFHASPTIFQLMLAEREETPVLPDLKILACGSGNMPAEVIKELKDWMPQMAFRTVYGLSETTSPATIFPRDAATSPYIGSSGLPIPGVSIKIMGENGREQGNGVTGEIWIAGPNVIEAYYRQDTNLITNNGWLMTGDIGYVNEEGYLYVIDRKKDMINRGGEKVYCFDVENALHEIKGVQEAAVVGVKHQVYGESPVAFIKLKPGWSYTEAQFKEQLKPKLARFKIPEAFNLVKEIYKTPNGKIDKKRIRELYEAERSRNESYFEKG